MEIFATLFVLACVAAYFAMGARKARKVYVLFHQDWWDTHIVERKQMLHRKGKHEEPGETRRVLRKEWQNGSNAQGDAMGLAFLAFFLWPVVMPVIALAKDPEPSNEEQKLIIAQQEAELDELRRQQGL